MHPSWLRTAWRLLLTLLVIRFIAGMTLHSAKYLPSHTTFFCLWGCDGEELRDLLSNIVLFVPLGWVLSYWFRSSLAVWLCILATIGIELTQGLYLTGRDPSLRDILTNSVGGAIGVWLYHHWSEVVYGDRRTSLRWALGAFGCWSAVLLATGIGLHADGSQHPWYGQWGNYIESYALFDGEVREVALGNTPIPAGPLPAMGPLQAAFARDSIDLHVVAINRTVTRPTALIFALVDEYDGEMLFVGAAHRSIELQVRNRFTPWGLRELRMRLPLSPGSQPHDTLDITAQVRSDVWRLKLRSRGEVDSIALPLTVGLGWATLLPARLTISYEWYVMNALWIAILVAPAVYWWRRARPRRGWHESAGIIIGVLLVVPLVAGVGASSRSDWIGGALGLLAGVVLARRSLQRHPVA